MQDCSFSRYPEDLSPNSPEVCLSHVNFNVGKGELLGVVGAMGTGKMKL